MQSRCCQTCRCSQRWRASSLRSGMAWTLLVLLTRSEVLHWTLFNMFILPLVASFTSALICCITLCHFMSQQLLKCCEVCWGDHVCSLFCWSCCYCCCYRRVVLGLGVSRAFPLVASLTDAPLPCQMQLCFVARLEPTRMRWEDDHVRMTSLETNVQECNSVKSVCNSTLSLGLGWLCAQADCGTHRCWNKILPYAAFRSFVMR